MSNVDRKKGIICKIVLGCKNVHCVHSINAINSTLLEAHLISCFHAYCTNAIGGSCLQQSHVSPWILKTLEPCGPTNKACDLDNDHTRIGGNGDDMTRDILLEDSFLTKAEVGNKENCQWWVLQCTQPLHTLTQFVGPNGFGNCFRIEFDLLTRRYCRQQGRNRQSFILLQDFGLLRI